MDLSSAIKSASQRITLALFLAQSFFSAAMIASFTLTPIIAAQLSGSDSAAGVPNTVNLLGRAAIAYPIGWLMDRAGRRNGLSLGYLLGTLGALLSAVAVIRGAYGGFLVGAALMGAARGSAEQSRYVAAEAQPAERRAKVMGLVVFAGTVGAIGGPLLAAPSGRFVAGFNLNPMSGIFVVSTVLFFLALAVTFALLRPDPLAVGRQIAAVEQRDRPDASLASEAVRPLRQIFAGATVQAAVAAILVSQLVMTLLMVITPLNMDHHNHSTEAISWVIMAHTLGMFGLSGLTGWLIDRLGRVPMILIGTGLLAVSSLLAPVSLFVPIIAFVLFLLGLGWNFCFIAGSSLLSDELRINERGRTQGASEMMVALASGAGSLSTGIIFAGGGMIAVSTLGLLLSLFLFGIVSWIFLPSRKVLLP